MNTLYIVRLADLRSTHCQGTVVVKHHLLAEKL